MSGDTSTWDMYMKVRGNTWSARSARSAHPARCTCGVGVVINRGASNG